MAAHIPDILPYTAPRWLPGGHAQTIYAALATPRPRVAYRRTRWDTPDGDFIDLDWVEEGSGSRIQDAKSRTQDRGARFEPGLTAVNTPLVVLFHGLEGNSRSHYARALMQGVCSRGWRGAIAHFRGCSGELNLLPRAYHSGDSAEIDWILRRLHREHAGPLFAVGVSLGGNALLKWLGEQRSAAGVVVKAAAAVSAPVDLMASGSALDRGFNRVYVRHFLATMKHKARAKLERFPGLFDGEHVVAAQSLRDFDDLVTAPLHGFRNTDDYWTRASSKPLLGHIVVPTLMINARNDPFLPQHALPQPHEVSHYVTLDLPAEGGHVGFVSGAFPGHLDWLPQRVLGFFAVNRHEIMAPSTPPISRQQ